MAQLDPPDKF